MNRATSLYLDVVRFAAALTVLLTHLAYPRFSGGMLLPWRSFGNDAVMVFFVLSGYVIAYTAAHRDHDLGSYALNRCARLYSVALPAIVLTIVLDQLGRWWAPVLYQGFKYQDSEPLMRVLRGLSFSNEWWLASWRLFSNGPYWSLGYEAWYYVLFGCAWYLRGASRALSLLLVMALIGPKILLLLPVWMLGVAVFRINSRYTLSARVGAALWLGSVVLYSGFRAGGGRDTLLGWTHAALGQHFVEHSLHWSNEFLASYVIGLLVAIHFIGVHACAPTVAPMLLRFEKPLRAWAGCTFSLYLFHYPLLQFFAASGAFDPHSPLAVGLLALFTLLSCRALATVTEARKDVVRALLSRGVRRLRQHLPAARLSW